MIRFGENVITDRPTYELVDRGDFTGPLFA